MNKAFEKILERLETDEKHTFDGCINKQYMKQIVQEIAEEYVSGINVGNDGWIPCNDRLPNQDGEFTDILITCESMSDGVFVQSAEFYIATDGSPVFDALYHYERVLAWKPLPEPYHPKGA